MNNQLLPVRQWKRPPLLKCRQRYPVFLVFTQTGRVAEAMLPNGERGVPITWKREHADQLRQHLQDQFPDLHFDIKEFPNLDAMRSALNKRYKWMLLGKLWIERTRLWPRSAYHDGKGASKRKKVKRRSQKEQKHRMHRDKQMLHRIEAGDDDATVAVAFKVDVRYVRAARALLAGVSDASKSPEQR